MRSTQYLILAAFIALLTGCANVDVTKTAKGFHDATNPAELDILMTVPDRPYTELGTIGVSGYAVGKEAKMHNALRAKSAPLGANAVILTDRGIHPGGLFSSDKMWANGVAIRYK